MAERKRIKRVKGRNIYASEGRFSRKTRSEKTFNSPGCEMLSCDDLWVSFCLCVAVLCVTYCVKKGWGRGLQNGFKDNSLGEIFMNVLIFTFVSHCLSPLRSSLSIASYSVYVSPSSSSSFSSSFSS